MDTIVTRTLDEYGIGYVVTAHDNPAFTCEEAARERGIPLPQILKCMVGRDISGNIYVMLIPGDRIIKMKKMRRIVGGMINLIPPIELTEKFSLTIGAISPMHFIGKAKFYLEQTVLNEEYIDISSGLLNAGIELKTKDFVDFIRPTICDIISSNSKASQLSGNESKNIDSVSSEPKPFCHSL